MRTKNRPTATTTPPSEVSLLKTADVAQLLSLSERTLENWRQLNTGPAFLKLGTAVRYRLSDVLAWATAGAGDIR